MIDSTRPPVIPLWPAGAPGSSAPAPPERESLLPPRDLVIVRNVSRPTLTAYLPRPSTSTGTAVIVCPGGAFHFLAIAHEGTDVASWLVERGVAAFVLRYRVIPTPARDEDFLAQFRENMANLEKMRALMASARHQAIADGQRAVQVVRERAAAWGVAPDRVGMIGFSAGAAVTSGVALQPDAAGRLDFAAPIYGALWEDVAVPANAPPLFLALASDDDMAVRTSLPLYTKWRDAGRPVELHVFAQGGHGFGMRRQGLPADHWIDLFGEWLGAQGLLRRSGSA
ncbi:MAG: alpha/beta hydrolase [Chloroflexota bacterium]